MRFNGGSVSKMLMGVHGSGKSSQWSRALAVLPILVAGLAFAPAAFGSLVFSLDDSGCSSGCNVLPAGTVTIVQNGADTVQVAVDLVDDYSFRDAPDANHHSLVWNLLGSPVITVANLTSGDTVAQVFNGNGPGAYNNSPHGSFGYFLECDGCVTGAPVSPTRFLQFDVTASGLMESSFLANTDGYFFSVDVVGISANAGVGLTGNIGTKGFGIEEVPEPGTAVFVAGGLFLLAALERRRRTHSL